MHVGGANDGSTLDANALASLIDAIRARSYRLTDVYAYAGRYAHVADDGSARFSASGNWETSSSNPERYGLAYHYAQPGAVSDPARFRVRIPQSTTYRVYAWWPADPDYNSASAFALDTMAGRRWFRVDQRANGGRWNYLGKFGLSAGERRIVRVARRTDGRGLVIADEIRVTSPRPPGLGRCFDDSSARRPRTGRSAPAIPPRDAALPPEQIGRWRLRRQNLACGCGLQGWEGLDRDGLVGPATRAALERARPPHAWGGLRRGLELDLTDQVLLMVSGGAAVRAIHVSSGRPGYCTPVGRFSVYRRERLSWSEHYEAWMPYALYFYRGYAIHGYPDVPAQPASHGCVRVPMLEAPTVWSFAPLATPVWIR